jgi:hypothetical protein
MRTIGKKNKSEIVEPLIIQGFRYFKGAEKGRIVDKNNASEMKYAKKSCGQLATGE